MELIVETSVFDDERLSDDVQEVQQVASTAMDIAGNNSQYFWCTEVGTDTGVHITLTPQDTFKANPSGYNLLARNNGVEVRDGLTACSVFTNGGTYFNAMLNGTNQLVAKYEASGAQIGAELSGYRNITIDNTNGIRFRNGTIVLAKYDTGSVVFYDSTGSHALSTIDNTGMTLRNNSGYKTLVASGSGMTIYSGTSSDIEIANFSGSGMTLKNSNGYKTFYAGNNGLSVYDGVSTEYELLRLSTTGLVLKDNTGLQYASFGGNAIIGRIARGYSRTSITSGGMKVLRRSDSSDTDVTLAHIGYDTGQDSSGSTSSSSYPYYTFGTRNSDTASTRGNYSFAQGYSVKAQGYASHAEGTLTTASGPWSHAEGRYTTASGRGAHADGNETEAKGEYSNAQNLGTIANYNYQTVIGKYNNNKSTDLFEIGKGTGTSARANAFAVTTDGALEIGDPATTFIVQSTSSTASFTGTHTFDLTAPTVSGYTPICFLNWNITGNTQSYCYGIASQGSISPVTIKIRNTDSSTSITCTGYWLYCKTT